MGKKEEFRAQLAEANITDKSLSEWENRIGVDLRVSNIFNSTVTYETIRNFSNGIGDSNPLYRDPEYAEGTRFGALVASPSKRSTSVGLKYLGSTATTSFPKRSFGERVLLGTRSLNLASLI